MTLPIDFNFVAVTPGAPPRQRAFARAEKLIVLPLPMRVAEGGRILFEQQACNGLARWAEHFQSLLVAAPTIPEALAAQKRSFAWRDADEIEHRERIDFVPLPWAVTLGEHMRHARRARRLMQALIDHADYLHFGIGALFGDWAAIAAEEALRLGRPYAIHVDRVEHEVVFRNAQDKPLLRRVKARVYGGLMQRWHRRLIAHSSLLMCHGYDTYEAYRHLTPHAHVVHNVHTTASDQATPQQVEQKTARVRAGGALTVVYAGRLDEEKAPIDWIRAIARAIERGADVQATWIGDGALREAAHDEIRRLKLQDRIRLPGFTSDRTAVLTAIREADVLLFTHVTPESPRVLIEALISATPIVGYQSHYPADLIAGHGGGILSPMQDPLALGDRLAELARDRLKLSELIQAASASGRQFTSESVFRHRSELIRSHLPQLCSTAI